jgi:hypothetical protein
MTTVEKTRKKRVFIASSKPSVAEIQKAMESLDLHAVTMEHAATPGTSWVESLHRCVKDADMVIGIMDDRSKDTNVLFELGVATALNKPTFLFITPDFPVDLVPPSGIPYLRMDFRDENSVLFGLRQVISLSPRTRSHQRRGGFTTKPIGSMADELLAKLSRATPLELEDLIYEALRASGALTIARGSESEGKRIDFAVWSSDLEPTITNPLLIECKSSLRSQSDVNQAMGQMVRALEAIHNGCGLVLYKEASEVPKASSRFIPVMFISAAEFIEGLRTLGLAEFVRKLRNSAVHGL